MTETDASNENKSMKAMRGYQNTQRRFMLENRGNPNSSIDYLVDMCGEAVDDRYHVTIYYVPDKFLLKQEAFEHYLHDFQLEEVEMIEDLALVILGDLNNELVPRWVQVKVHAKDNRHCVLVEDRQPSWENAELLSRLKKF